MVNTVIENDKEEKKHPQAKVLQKPDAEQLLVEIDELSIKWKEDNTTMEEKNVIKDKLRYVQARSKWVQHADHKSLLQEKIDTLWQTMLQTT